MNFMFLYSLMVLLPNVVLLLPQVVSIVLTTAYVAVGIAIVLAIAGFVSDDCGKGCSKHVKALKGMQVTAKGYAKKISIAAVLLLSLQVLLPTSLTQIGAVGGTYVVTNIKGIDKVPENLVARINDLLEPTKEANDE